MLNGTNKYVIKCIKTYTIKNIVTVGVWYCISSQILLHKHRVFCTPQGYFALHKGHLLIGDLVSSYTKELMTEIWLVFSIPWLWQHNSISTNMMTAGDIYLVTYHPHCPQHWAQRTLHYITVLPDLIWQNPGMFSFTGADVYVKAFLTQKKHAYYYVNIRDQLWVFFTSIIWQKECIIKTHMIVCWDGLLFGYHQTSELHTLVIL